MGHSLGDQEEAEAVSSKRISACQRRGSETPAEINGDIEGALSMSHVFSANCLWKPLAKNDLPDQRFQVVRSTARSVMPTR